MKQELIQLSKLIKWNGESVVRPHSNVFIKSDSNLIGCGAICPKKNKNGRSLDEKQKGSGNKVMITYINNMGDTKSKKFINLANTCNSNKGVPTRGYEKRARLEKSS